MRARWFLLGLFILAVFGKTSTQAQFRADIDLVTLDVCVRDTGGHLVSDLTAADFVVFENGVPQRLAFFGGADALPLNVILLLDRSASMFGEKLDRARSAASEFAERVRAEDRLELIAFNQRATLLRPLAGNVAAGLPGLGQLTAAGSTALYDAMILAASQLARARRVQPEAQTRDLIIILSDGEDTASVVGFDEVLPLLRRSGALVYGLSLRSGEDGGALGATWPLQQLARDTGARAIGVRQLDSLEQLYAQIDQEARQMYRLGYVSTDSRARGEWRQLAVRVARPNVQARTRAGYYAAPPRRSGVP
jgi:Ca-activated chloride channel family protein